MSYNPTIRERIEKSGIQPLKEMVKEIDSAQQEWTPEYVKELFGGGSFPHFVVLLYRCLCGQKLPA